MAEVEKEGRQGGNQMEVVKGEKNGIWGLFIAKNLDPVQGSWLGAFVLASTQQDHG